MGIRSNEIEVAMKTPIKPRRMQSGPHTRASIGRSQLKVAHQQDYDQVIREFTDAIFKNVSTFMTFHRGLMHHEQSHPRVSIFLAPQPPDTHCRPPSAPGPFLPLSASPSTCRNMTRELQPKPSQRPNPTIARKDPNVVGRPTKGRSGYRDNRIHLYHRSIFG